MIGKKISCEVKSIFTGPDRYFALMRAKELMERYESVYPKFVQKLVERFFNNVTTICHCEREAKGKQS